MSEARGLAGLRAAAEATLLHDVRVTPELQAQVLERIARAPAHREPARPFSRWIGGAGWVVAATLTAVLVFASRTTPPPTPSAGTTSSFGGAVAPPAPAPRPAPAAAPAPSGAYSLGATAQNQNGVPVKELDQGGNSVVDAAGNSVAGSGSAKLTMTDQVAASAVQAPTPAAPEVEPGRQIIVNGEYGLEVSDVQAAVEQLRSLTAAAGGYVADASLSNSPGSDASAHLTLRIPTAQFAGSSHKLRDLGRVTSEREWTQDVTDQYMDLEHRVAIQAEQEQRLRDLAAKAATFDDWNRVTSQQNETRAQIENMQGKRKLLSNQVQYAIVTVTLQQSASGASVLPANPTLGQQVGQSFVRSWHDLIQALRRALVSLASLAAWAVFVLPLLAIAGLLLWRSLRLRRAP